jgi:hypothetical protein
LAAIERGDDDRVIELLQSGADPNSQDPLGRTALMYAGINGQTRLMKLLIAKGADVNAVAQGFNRVTPLIASVLFGDPNAVRLLLEHGADASTRDSQGWTALSWAESRYKTAPEDRSDFPQLPERNPHGDLAFATKKEFKQVIAALQGPEGARREEAGAPPPSDLAQLVGTWQFPGYEVWVQIREDGSALQCRVGDGTIYASRGRVLPPASVAWNQKLWGVERLKREGETLVFSGVQGTRTFVGAHSPMDSRCATREALERGERDVRAPGR